MRFRFFSFYYFLVSIFCFPLLGDVEVVGAIKSGYLKDTLAISGIDYQCTGGSLQKTDGSGKFSFDSSTCREITFSLNNRLILGKIDTSKIPQDYKIFLTDLAGVSRTTTNSVKVRNLARLLQTLDTDQNPLNGIAISSSQITDSKNINLSLWQSDLNLLSIIQQQYPTRTQVVSDIEAIVHLEEALRDNGFYVDTVAPYPPKVANAILATANNKTYIELIGERNSTIWLDDSNTTLHLDQDGRYYDFELNTHIRHKDILQFDIVFADGSDKKSNPLRLKIFSDTDQPYFTIPLTDQNLTLPSGTTIISPITVTDDSVTYGGLSLTYELLGDHKDLFEIDSSKNLRFKSPATAGTYNLQVKVKDEANHYDYRNFTITITP